jgi:hypothetical protein
MLLAGGGARDQPGRQAETTRQHGAVVYERADRDHGVSVEA